VRSWILRFEWLMLSVRFRNWQLVPGALWNVGIRSRFCSSLDISMQVKLVITTIRLVHMDYISMKRPANSFSFGLSQLLNSLVSQ